MCMAEMPIDFCSRAHWPRVSEGKVGSGDGVGVGGRVVWWWW